MPSSELPRGMSIVMLGSFVPCCDLCGWIGRDEFERSKAEEACQAHARTAEHLENESLGRRCRAVSGSRPRSSR